MKKKIPKSTAFTITILAPDGKLKTYDPKTPSMTATTDTIAETTIVSLKLLETCSAVTDGNIIILEISIVPTTRMPRTMVIAVSADMI